MSKRKQLFFYILYYFKSSIITFYCPERFISLCCCSLCKCCPKCFCAHHWFHNGGHARLCFTFCFINVATFSTLSLTCDFIVIITNRSIGNQTSVSMWVRVIRPARPQWWRRGWKLSLSFSSARQTNRQNTTNKVFFLQMEKLSFFKKMLTQPVTVMYDNSLAHSILHARSVNDNASKTAGNHGGREQNNRSSSAYNFNLFELCGV